MTKSGSTVNDGGRSFENGIICAFSFIDLDGSMHTNNQTYVLLLLLAAMQVPMHIRKNRLLALT